MENLQVLIYYNGQWDENFNYTNFKRKGVLLQHKTNFNSVVQVLSSTLKVNSYETEITVKFQVKDGCILEIEDDESLMFYIDLKKKERDITKYPLYISMEEFLPQFRIGQSSSITTNLINTEDQISIWNNDEQSATNTETKGCALDIIEYAKILSIEAANLEYKEEEEHAESQLFDNYIIVNPRHSEIEVGQIYRDKEILKQALSFYAINNHFQYKVRKSCNKEYHLICYDTNCNWNFRASRNGETNMFIIRKLNNTHTCPPEVRMNEQRQATSAIIGECVKSKFLSIKTIYTASDIARDMKDEYGVSVNYQKAYRSRVKALENVRGKPSESYALLPSYIYMLKMTNVGSVAEIQTIDGGKFQYVFIALDASIKGWSFCRPVIVVDGTFLKANYGGTLLSAATQDGAGKIFPLAFAVVDSENDASWEWFFLQLKQAFGVRDGLCIVSDRNDSIEKAVNKLYPEGSHLVCIFHLFNNLKTKFRRSSNKIKDSFFAAAKSYTKSGFQYHMNELCKCDKKIFPYLNDVGFKKWTRSLASRNRFSTMTSNIAESLNSTNRAARELPISILLECLRGLIQEWSSRNRHIANSTFTKLTQKAEDMLTENYLQSLSLKVIPSSGNLYSVMKGIKTYVVDLKERTCTCNRFQIDEMPCAHAVAILKYLHQDTYQYCSEFYTKETMIATYAPIVYPIASQSTWDIPDEVKETYVLPPKGKVPPGRPKKRRFVAASEHKQKTTCGRCGHHGHNKRTCRSLPK